MIHNKQELRFYIVADRIINGFPMNVSIKEHLTAFFFQNSKLQILNFLKYMRKTCYYHSVKKTSICKLLLAKWYGYRYSKLSIKLGFSIGPNVFGYGLLIPHYGTIVVNSEVRAGNFCVLHTSTCIGGANKIIGDALYLASGAKIMGNINLGNGISVASGSLVNKSFADHELLGGMPAKVLVENYPFWYQRDGEKYIQRVKQIEILKKVMLKQ